MSTKKTKHVLLTTGKSGFSEFALTMNLFVMDVCSSASVQPLVAYTTANESPEPDRAPKMLVESAPKPLEASKSKQGLTARTRTSSATSTRDSTGKMSYVEWRFSPETKQQIDHRAVQMSLLHDARYTRAQLLVAFAEWLASEQPDLTPEPHPPKELVPIRTRLAKGLNQQLFKLSLVGSARAKRTINISAMCRAGMAEMLTRLDTMEPVPLESLVEALCEHPRAKKKKQEHSLESKKPRSQPLGGVGFGGSNSSGSVRG